MSLNDVPQRRRIDLGAVMHAAAVAVFGLMALLGAGTLPSDARAMGVPMLIAGTAGAAGSLTILLGRSQRAARRGMLLAAVLTVAAGVALAPAGWERGIVIGVNIGVGALLAVFAALAGSRTAGTR